MPKRHTTEARARSGRDDLVPMGRVTLRGRAQPVDLGLAHFAARALDLDVHPDLAVGGDRRRGDQGGAFRGWSLEVTLATPDRAIPIARSPCDL